MVSDYEKAKAAQIAKNKALLKTLGLEKPLNEPKLGLKMTLKRKSSPDTEHVDVPTPKIQRVRVQTEMDKESTALRRSSRNSGKKVDYSNLQSTGLPQPLIRDKISGNEGSMGREAGQRIHDPKTFGHIPGVAVGTWWLTREACSRDAIHAPWVGGISGGSQGAHSVVISGGYDDDIDLGYGFTYTGSGGRDLKGTKTAPKNLRTAPQSSDQTFENNFNNMLRRSCETKNPVRVVRGFKARSKYAPIEGYRYDGLYRVEKAWSEKGLNPKGYLVCKYAFKRLAGQPPLPVNLDYEEEGAKTTAAEDA
ncbi:hypothetical protein Ac2012v2_000661 [Leucoagaricus gongylophorus]